MEQAVSVYAQVGALAVSAEDNVTVPVGSCNELACLYALEVEASRAVERQSQLVCFQLLGCYGCESVNLYFQWTCHLELSQSQAFAATHDELIYKWRVDVCHQHGFVGHFVAVVQT